MSARYGNGYYKDSNFQFVLDGDDPEHQLSDSPEFEERVETGHLPAMFEHLHKAGWVLVTSCLLPARTDTVLFIFRKE